MADARKFVLPGQPPGTSRSPLLPGLGFSALPTGESTENSMDFPFLAVGLLRLRMRFRLKMERRKKKTFTCCVDRGQAVLNGVHLKNGRAS
jgi:hypothetical protein